MSVSQPAPGPVKNISYPQVPEQKLPNGLPVLTVEDHRLPRVSVRLACEAGRICSPDHNLSLSPLTLELLKEGADSRSSRQISALMDRLAIEYHTGLQMEYCLLSMDALEDHMKTALELMADLLQRPTFPPEELDRLKVRWRSELLAQRTQPAFLARERIFHTLYAGHPYAKVSIPPPHLEEATREQVSEIHQGQYQPGTALLLLTGPVGPERSYQLADRFFGSWTSVASGTPDPHPPPPAVQERRICLVHRPHSAQSKLLVAIRTVPRAHPDMMALRLGNQVLGGGGSARLFLNLREDKGYTYGAYSVLKGYRQDGTFLVSADVNTEATADSLSEIFRELEILRTSPPAPEELSRCRAEIMGAYIRQMQTPASIGEMELIRRIYRLPEDYYQTFIPRLRSTGEEEVLQCCQRYLADNRAVTAVVADREQVEAGLRSLGEVRVYDTSGNEI